MNPTPEREEDAELRALLNRAMPPLDDGGFSQRVVAALPEPAENTLFWRRFRFCLIGSAMGSVCAIWSIISGVDAASSASLLGTDLLTAATRLAEPPLALALAVALGSLLYVFGSELKERLFE